MTDTEIPADIRRKAEQIAKAFRRELNVDAENDLKRDVEIALLAERRRHTVEAQPVEFPGCVLTSDGNTHLEMAFETNADTKRAIDLIVRVLFDAAPTPPSRAEVTPVRYERQTGSNFNADGWALTDESDVPFYLARGMEVRALYAGPLPAALAAGKKEGAR